MGDRVVKVVRAIVVLGVVTVICVGCQVSYDPNGIEGGDRFIVEQSSNAQTLFVDKETGVEYLWLHSSCGDALVALVDENGKPLVKKELVE